MPEVAIAPPNSLLLITACSKPTLPDSMSGELVQATADCAAVGTRSETDGVTTVRLVRDPPDAEDGRLELAFDGVLKNCSGAVRVTNIHDELYLEQATQQQPLRLRVWTNDPWEPDLIIIETDIAG
jgi:hypothetical protein